jgi:hypothetical protein
MALKTVEHDYLAVRDVLRAEFGDLAPLARRIPRPALAPTGALWRALAAIGVGWIVGAIGSIALGIFWDVVDPRRIGGDLVPIGRQLVEVVATAAAVAVASSGGRRPLLLYLGFELALVAFGLLRLSASIPIARERGFPVDVFEPATALLQRWPLAVGLILGLLVARWVGTTPRATNALMEAAGIRVAVPRAAFALFGLAVPFADQTWLPFSILLQLTGAIAAGGVLAVRADRPLRTAFLLAALAIATWVWPFGFWQISLAIRADEPLAHVLPVALPLLDAGVIVVATTVLVAARAARHALPT